MLASEEFSAGFFAHGSGAGRAIGFACRHFGEEAFEEKRRIKKPVQKQAKPIPNIIQGRPDGYIDAEKEMTGEYSVETRRGRGNHTLPRTSVVLLLLVVVAELPFTLCRHPTLRLHHLFYFIRAILVPLRGIEALRISGGMHSGAFELADRMVSLGAAAAAAHTRVCRYQIRISKVNAASMGRMATYRNRGIVGPSSWASSPGEEHSTASRS